MEGMAGPGLPRALFQNISQKIGGYGIEGRERRGCGEAPMDLTRIVGAGGEIETNAVFKKSYDAIVQENEAVDFRPRVIQSR